MIETIVNYGKYYLTRHPKIEESKERKKTVWASQKANSGKTFCGFSLNYGRNDLSVATS